MADEASLETVMNRKEFYRDGYRKLIIIVLGLLIGNIFMASIIFYMKSHEAAPRYFATSADGRITRLYAMTEPVVSVSALLDWSRRASVAAYSYDFVHYRGQLQAASEYFTPDGWEKFINALRSSGNLKTVIAKKLVATAVPTGVPVLLNRGVIDGKYSWKVRLPLLVTYQSQSQTFQQTVMVTMIVARVPNLNDPKGIAIVQFVASAGGGGG
jgi:intracellular multiplication protein IcmL